MLKPIFYLKQQIVIDGGEASCIDIEGSRLPTMVYMAREKRPNHPHHFKAGAMNALVSFLLLVFRLSVG